MMNKYKDKIFLIFWTLMSLQITLGQVRMNSEKLQNEFHITVKRNRRLKNDSWFQPDSMSDLTKFILCIDVIQKVDDIELMHGQYLHEDVEALLPNFQSGFKKVYNTIEGVHEKLDALTLHCPLHLIQFEKIAYLKSKNFYVTESLTDHCVYMLNVLDAPPGYEPFLELAAEVCGLFANVKYDTKLLEDEFSLYQRNQLQFDWPEVSQMDNENRFLLCLEVFEILSRYHFHYEYDFTNVDDLPEFVTVTKDLVYTSEKKFIPDGTISTLFCPMDKVKLPKIRMFEKNNMVSPFYLAKSEHEAGCVYKLGNLYNFVGNAVHILAKICGLAKPMRSNTTELEREFVQKWSMLPAGNSKIPSLMAKDLSYTNMILFVENIYRKFYKNIMRTTIRKSLHTSDKELIFITVPEDSMIVWTMQIHFSLDGWAENDTAKPFFIADSVNIGCIYVLTVHPKNQKFDLGLVIRHEICDVYPVQYFLNIKINNMIFPLA